MGFGESSTFLKVTLLLVALGLLVQVLAVALPYWFSQSSDAPKLSVYGGLWEVCTETENQKACLDVMSAADWFKSVQAFEVIGMIALAAALVLTLFVVFCSDARAIKFLACIGSFVACGCIFLGVFIYAGEAWGSMKEYGASFALAIIAAIISIVSGLLGLLDCLGKGR